MLGAVLQYNSGSAHTSDETLTRRLSMTPLELRASLRRIRKCSERRRLLWQLLYPRPWRFQAKPLPPTHDVFTVAAKAAGSVPSASRVQRNILQLHFVEA